MSNKILPLFGGPSPNDLGSNEPTVVREVTVTTTYRETGATSIIEASTNHGTRKLYTEEKVKDSSSSQPIVTEPDAAEDRENRSLAPIPQAIPSRSPNTGTTVLQQQLTVSPENTVAIKADSEQIHFSVTDFVPVPTTSKPIATMLDDPSDFAHFKLYVKNKFCYDPTPLTVAKTIKTQEHVAYQVDIWTLMEQRSVKQHQRPYGDESAGGRAPPANLCELRDSPLTTPNTIVEGTSKQSCALENTERKATCTSCRGVGKTMCTACRGQGQVIPRNNNNPRCTRCAGTGKLSCTKCDGRGSLLIWEVLTSEWRTKHTKSCYQDINTSTDLELPQKKIFERSNKKIFFDDDLDWNGGVFLTGYGSLYENIGIRVPTHFAKKLGQEIQKQYQTHLAETRPSQLMPRLKCVIRQVDIIQIDYQLEGYANKSKHNRGTDTFSYLVYGRHADGTAMIYEDDYPHNCCGCLGAKASCRSSCSIL